VKEGEAILTDHPLLGSDCYNDRSATIFPMDKDEKGAIPALAFYEHSAYRNLRKGGGTHISAG